MAGDRFARLVFRVAGIYGLVVITPLYFMERLISEAQPPAITHPEHFYGFVGVTLAWQVAFLVIATDPERYRPLMLVAVLEKLTYAIAVAVLWALDRIAASVFWTGSVDWIFVALFVAAYLRTSNGGAMKAPANTKPQTSP